MRASPALRQAQGDLRRSKVAGFRHHLARLRGSTVEFDLRSYAKPLAEINDLEAEVSALALDRGKIVEMQTSEGMTLAAVMPATLNAFTDRGLHVLTFNDYLARRDAEWMGPIYCRLGVSVGFIQEGMSRAERQRAYLADVT